MQPLDPVAFDIQRSGVQAKPTVIFSNPDPPGKLAGAEADARISIYPTHQNTGLTGHLESSRLHRKNRPHRRYGMPSDAYVGSSQMFRKLDSIVIQVGLRCFQEGPKDSERWFKHADASGAGVAGSVCPRVAVGCGAERVVWNEVRAGVVGSALDSPRRGFLV